MASVGLGYVRETQLKAATTGTAQGTIVQGCTNVSVYITGTGTISGGTIIIETADYQRSQAAAVDGGYAGTWSGVITVNASDVTGDAQKAVSLGQAGWSVVRTRIGDDVTGGGSVSTTVIGV